ncbi:hypothetical protein Bca4012_084208 [Brassica carinata]
MEKEIAGSFMSIHGSDYTEKGLAAFEICSKGKEICGANDNQARRYLVCGLPANRIKPQLHQQPRQEADDDQGTDVEEITRIEFRLSMGYFVRIEEPEEDIDPMFRRVVQKLKENACPKREQGESSRGKSHR